MEYGDIKQNEEWLSLSYLSDSESATVDTGMCDGSDDGTVGVSDGINDEFIDGVNVGMDVGSIKLSEEVSEFGDDVLPINGIAIRKSYYKAFIRILK